MTEGLCAHNTEHARTVLGGFAARVLDEGLKGAGLGLEHGELAVDDLLVDRVVEVRHLLQQHCVPRVS